MILYNLKDHAFVAVLNVDKSNGFLQALEVSDAYRRKGIAGKLLKISREVYNCRDLTVAISNTPAINLYIKEGYVEVKRTDKQIFMRYSKRN